MTARLLPRVEPLWLRALARCLPHRHRDQFLGDLMEEYEEFVRPSRGPLAARIWLWRQALQSAAAGLAHRIYDRFRRTGALGAGPGLGGRDSGRSQVDILAQDLRYAFRRLLGSPGFTAVAVLSLALGVGANTALFSIVNTLLLKGVGVEDPETLVEIYTADNNGYPYLTSSYPDYFDLREQDEVFQDVISYNLTFAQIEVDGGEPRMSLGEIVSGDYFSALGIRPQLGRGFLPEEDATPDTHPVVVISHQYWRGAFNADRDVIGKSVRLLRRPYTIVGVAPEGFGGMWPGVRPDFYVPQMMVDHMSRAFGGTRLENRGNRSLFMKGRLRPGVTAEQAAEFVATFSQGLAQAYPDTNENRPMTVLASEDVALHPFVDKAMLPIAGLLFAVVGLVLLIACTNLASFLLARGSDRRREIAVRLALGARRRTLVRQLLTETVLLALLGGAAGLLLAHWTITLILSYQPPIPIPLNLDVGVDGNVFAFALGISVAAGLLFGLLPAVQSTNPDVAPTLRDESGATTGNRKRWSLRNGLVVVQVALSFVLLIGAGLFVRSLQKAQAIDPGFDTSEAAMIWPNMEMSLIEEEEGRLVLDDLKLRIGAIPGVSEVAAFDRIPLGMGVQTTNVLPQDVPTPETMDFYEIDYAVVDESYFDVMGVPVLQGRAFQSTDVRAGELVAIVSEAFVREFWPGQSGLGKTLARTRDRQFRVVGVAADTKVRTLGEDPRPQVYFSTEQNYVPLLYLFARGTLPEAQLLGEIERVVREARSDLVIMDSATMTEHLALPLYAPRMAAILLGVFGGLALLLSGIGLYGVVSYAVSRRTREVGIRMSLGADPWQVVRMVVGSGMRMVVVGGLVGMVLSAGVTWLLSRFLYGISTMDVATFVVIPLLLTAVAGVAAFLPARRASRVNPVDALRSD